MCSVARCCPSWDCIGTGWRTARPPCSQSGSSAKPASGRASSATCSRSTPTAVRRCGPSLSRSGSRTWASQRATRGLTPLRCSPFRALSNRNGSPATRRDTGVASAAVCRPVHVNVAMASECSQAKHVARARRDAKPAGLALRCIDAHEGGLVVSGEREVKAPGDEGFLVGGLHSVHPLRFQLREVHRALLCDVAAVASRAERPSILGIIPKSMTMSMIC